MENFGHDNGVPAYIRTKHEAIPSIPASLELRPLFEPVPYRPTAALALYYIPLSTNEYARTESGRG
jgi:hypothetical protein